MKLQKARITKLMQDQGLSQNRLAYKIGVTRGALSKALSGKRQAGRKLLAGLLRKFPNESVSSLTVNERQVVV